MSLTNGVNEDEDDGNKGKSHPSNVNIDDELSTKSPAINGISIVIDSPKSSRASRSSRNSYWNSPQKYDDDGDIVNYGSLDTTPIRNHKKYVSKDDDETNRLNPATLEQVSIDKLSKDIDSIYAGHRALHRADTCEPKTSWWKQPKMRENWKVLLTAFGLLIVGIGLIAMGIVVTIIPDIDIQSYVFFIAGAICFIPGAYHIVFVCCALKGRKGYDFHQLPLFT